MADLPYAELERLYKLLGDREIDAGVLERLRVERILEHAGAPGDPLEFTGFIEEQREVLRRRLRALLAKSGEQGRAVEEAFAVWITTLPRPAPAPRAPTPTRWAPETPQRPPRRSLRGLWTLAPLVVVAALVVVMWPSPKPPGEPTPEPAPDVEQGPVIEETVPVVTPEVAPPEPPPYPWWLVGVGVLGFGLAVGVLVAALARPRLPPPLPAPRAGGDARAGAEVAPTRGPLLLGRADQDALVWGIGQVFSDIFTDRLDAERTVLATAEDGGILSLHFERARAYRGVWLWIDRRGRGREDALRIAAEIESTLTQAGLPVHRALFSGIPDLLQLTDGSRRTPAQLGARHRGARVVVLTDGAVLGAHERSADQRARVVACLASLAEWEALAFGDLAGKVELALLLRRFGLPCLARQDLVAHLAGLRAGRRSGRGDLLAWEIACAVMARPVREDEALALRTALRLDVMPWDLPALRARAPGPNQTLRWTPAARAGVFVRFARGDRYAEGLVEKGVLCEALGWWRRRCDQVEAASLRSDEHWRETLPGMRLAGERAMLDLWTRPDDAVPVLFGLAAHDGPHVRALLDGFGDADSPGEDRVVRLPWRLRERPRAVRAMLRALGFVPALERPEGVLRPGVLGPAAAGVAVVGAVAAMGPEASLAAARQLAVAVSVATVAMWAMFLVMRMRRGRAWRFGHVLGNAVVAGALWRYEPALPEVEVEDLVDTTSTGTPPELEASTPETTGVEPDPPDVVEVKAEPVVKLVPPAPPKSCPDGQLLVKGQCKVKPRPQPACPEGTVREGTECKRLFVPVVAGRSAAGVPDLRLAPEITGRDPSQGEPNKRCPAGMALIVGTGPGGFVDGETRRNHVVGDVCMDITEVTVAAFARCAEKGNCVPAYASHSFTYGTETESSDCNVNRADRQNHPVNCVDLDQAKAYCRAAGKRLPTEWEWEWAARGREEGRTYPWGEAAPTCELAVMSKLSAGCGKERTWPVGSKRLGNSRDGLKDVSGNLREWTSSPYSDKYTIVRGGSWDDSDPVFFQAAIRFNYAPADRDLLLGFRCATTAPVAMLRRMP